MIDYEKLKIAHESAERYRRKTHQYIMLETNFMGTDIGSDGKIEDYLCMDYILYFNHETRMISRNIDEIIEEINRRIDITYPHTQINQHQVDVDRCQHERDGQAYPHESGYLHNKCKKCGEFYR